MKKFLKGNFMEYFLLIFCLGIDSMFYVFESSRVLKLVCFMFLNVFVSCF